METEARVSRRLVLRGIAGGGAALALSACGAGNTTTTTPNANPGGGGTVSDVIIVGAGIAGVHCAYRLKQRGVVAKVFEGSDHLGGRVSTDRTSFPEGMHVERGGELIDTDHTTMLALAKELSIELYDYDSQPGMNGVVGFVDGKRMTDKDMLAAFTPIAPKITAALASLKNSSAGVSYKNPNGGEALDQVSIASWFDSAGITGSFRKVMDAAYIGEYGMPLEQASSLDFLGEIGTDTDKFEMFGESDERFHTKTGNVTFIEKLAAPVASQITTGARLLALRRGSDGRYVATFDRVGDVRAVHVVLALPFSVLRDVALDASLGLSPIKLRAIRELAYGTNAKLMVGFKERVWVPQGVGGGEMFTDLAWQTGWETSRLQPGTSGIITNFVGGLTGLAMGQGTVASQMASFLDGFDACIPGAKAAANGVAVRANWPSNPFSKGSYSGYAVGQATAFGGVEGERAANLHFCGEHTSREAQGFMEGGAETGARVASEVLADLGLVKNPS